jgi:hypothetical protein
MIAEKPFYYLFSSAIEDFALKMRNRDILVTNEDKI